MNHKPSLREDINSEGMILLCPSCGCNCTHQDRVDVFERKADAEEGKHFTIEDGLCQEDTDMSRNPSRRRHGLSIELFCEGCHLRFALVVKQHKGETKLECVPSDLPNRTRNFYGVISS